MLLPPQFPQLLFVAQGTVLLHSTATTVTGWDFATRQARFTCAGRLMGASRAGTTFVTASGPETYGFWDCATGAAQPLTPAVLADLPFDVRHVLYLIDGAADDDDVDIPPAAKKRPRYQWCVMDAAGEKPPQILRQRDGGVFIENWAWVPDRPWFIYTTFYTDGMFDSASGHYRTAEGPRPIRPTVRVSRFNDPPPLYFSREHDWLLTGEQNAFNLYTASTGKPYRGQFYVYEGGGDVVAFHPHERYQLAVNLHPYLSAEEEKQGFRLLDVAAGRSDTGQMLQTCPETVPVAALAFHPSGTWVLDLLNNGAIHVWETATGQPVAPIANL